MIYLLYVSTANKLLSDAELVEILRISRENNAKLDITGLLLYQSGNFIQYIEGPDEAVLQLYEKISQDPRHYNVTRLLKESIEQRAFGEWAMGFKNIAELPPEVQAGFSNFLELAEHPEELENSPKRAATFLANFKELMR